MEVTMHNLVWLYSLQSGK